MVGLECLEIDTCTCRIFMCDYSGTGKPVGERMDCLIDGAGETNSPCGGK